jgi:hypothetical protein
VNPKQPPKWAASLLKRLGNRPENEAIAGDLAESFYSGKSRLWYCKEVLIAIAMGMPSGALRGITAGWILLSTVLIALFPVFGRCTVLVCIAGFGSGLAAGHASRHWLHVLLFSLTAQFYWIGLGIVSTPYLPVLWLYRTIGFGFVRSGQVSINLLIGNLVILTFTIWLGAACGHSPRITERASVL